MTLAFVSLASAQATRTWVSGKGLDSNPCTRTAPCATFQAAHDKTKAGGEINCVDAGDYGKLLSITKAITIDCGGTSGYMLVNQIPGGIGVSAGATDVVTIRNLSINGGGMNQFSGIGYSSGKALHVENVTISSFQFGTCIDVIATAPVLLTVDNTTLSDCTTGIRVANLQTTAVANISNTRIFNASTGVDADNGSRVTIRHTTIFYVQGGFPSNAVFQEGAFGTNLGSTVTVVNSMLGYSGTALVSNSGEFVVAIGNTFVNDALIFFPNGGTIFTGGDNKTSGSATGTVNGGTVHKI